MISIQQALALVSSNLIERKTIDTPISEGVGRTLAQAVYAPLSLPPFDNSAMDGYAVCGVFEKYDLVGEIQAGDTSRYVLETGKAFRIFTGAKVPENVTAVIMQEKVKVEGKSIVLDNSIKEGANVRRSGEEIKEGDLVFDAGFKLNPASIGLLSSLGVAEVKTYDLPKVSILVTGDELVEVGNKLKEGQIYESNGVTLKTALLQMNIVPVNVRRAKDNLADTQETIKQLLDGSDIVLISGGISVGEYDFVKKALQQNGVEEVFYKVNQKPGKPLFFGKKGRKRVFALPGNPASALTCFYVYVRPLLLHAMGIEDAFELEKGWLCHDWEVKGIRPVIYRAIKRGHKFEILDKQSSSMLHSFARGNMLALLEPGLTEKGAEVRVWKY